MAISDKLNYLIETKRLFKDRLNSLGAEIIESTTFRNYLNWLDTFYGDANDKTDLAKNGVVGRTSQNPTLPTDYTRVDYIESSGTQYIDTGHYPSSNNDELEIQASYVGDNTISCLFGTVESNYYYYQLNKTTTANQFRLITYRGDIFYTFEDYASKHTYLLEGNKLYIDNTEVITGSGTVNFESQAMYLFARNNVGTPNQFGSWRIYSCKIKTNDILVRDFIPCYRNSDNVVGLYDLVNNVFYTNQGTGVFTYGTVVTEPTPDYPLEINNLSGDVEYKVRGKNLFDKDNANILKGWFRDATDEMALNSVSTDRIIAFEGKPNTTYTISKKLSNRFRVDLYNSLLSQDGTYTFNYPTIKNDSGTNITVTTTATDYYIYIHVYQSSDGDFQAILNSIQIEYGNSASSYEPYISESFPLSLKSKNLFDGIFRQGMHVSITTANRLASTNAMKSTKNEYYTFSTNLPNIFEYKIMNDTSNSLDTTVVDDTSYTSSGKVTVKCTTDGYLKLLIKKTDNSNLTLSDISGYKFQVEKGNQESSYSPYRTPIELCKIGNYQDRIYKDNGKWYLNKQIGKVVFDGSESWTINTSYTYNVFYRTLDNYARIPNAQTTYCEYYKGIENAGGIANFGNNYNNSIGVRTANDNIKDIYISNNSITSASDFKTWLSTHNTVVYYVLATPTTTEITEENYPTLYSQLLATQEFLTKYKINKEFLLDYSSPEIEY